MPKVDGAKLTEIPQRPCGAMVEPQLLDCTNPALAAMLLMLTDAFVLFITATGCDGLVVPTA